MRLLGEDLILFRDRKGRPGLLYPRCMHRGTTLFYGKVEDEGIRCCYHGWLFGVDGTCLDQPCEPEHGLHRDVARQPWYPVEERYGLVFAYMGPPERKPILPRYDILENVGADQELKAFDNGLGTGGNGPGLTPPCNWLQHWENIMDPFHVVILHGTFSGTQFVDAMAVMPEVTLRAGADRHALDPSPKARRRPRAAPRHRSDGAEPASGAVAGARSRPVERHRLDRAGVGCANIKSSTSPR